MSIFYWVVTLVQLSPILHELAWEIQIVEILIISLALLCGEVIVLIHPTEYENIKVLKLICVQDQVLVASSQVQELQVSIVWMAPTSLLKFLFVLRVEVIRMVYNHVPRIDVRVGIDVLSLDYFVHMDLWLFL